MNENIKVSIIMPVYNAIDYIDVTIKSILNQTYKNFELIIIDDGATDGTGRICKKYADNNANIRYFKQKNEGTCVARNKGIELATGDFIAFSDHDDEYLNNYLEVLVEMVELYEVDVVKCGVFFDEEYADGTIKSRKEEFEREILTQNELVNRYNSLPISYFAVWNTLYKTDMLRNNMIRFPEKVRHGQEDYFFNTDIIPFLSKIGFSEKCLYKHYRRISQSTSAKFYEDRIEHISIYFKKECSILKPLINKHKWTEEYALLYARKITGVLSYIFRTQNNCNLVKSISILKKYLDITPYEETITLNLCTHLLHTSFKYSLVLYLALRHHYKVLIKIWIKKNKQKNT